MTSDTRQQLYDRIRETSMDEVILEEMIRHGFWPAEQDKPSLPAEMIRRRGELQREISELAARARAYEDRERAVKEIMKERMAAARERRVETKKRQAQARYDKAAQWYDKRRDDIVHLGDTGSPALSGKPANEERLRANGLPVFAGIKAIADQMGVPVGELRFLTYDRKVATVSHYKRFQIPKKTGGLRTVSAPMPRLKRAQYWLLENVLAKIEPHEAAHGFRPGRSILTNAAPHTGKAVVINFDLKDFFPSIKFNRVKGLFASFGYPEAQAAVFAMLATEADRQALELDGQVWHVATGERALPQGAPTSPAITNLLCRRLDRRLAGAARKNGFAYTRYADDLTFSAAAFDKAALDRLMKTVRFVVGEEGFAVNEAKTRVMHKGRHQEVTGLTVNDGVSVSRRERRKFRAYLHNAGKEQPSKPWRRGSPAASALGYAQFLSMVDRDGARSLADRAYALFADPAGSDRQGHGGSRRRAFRKSAAAGEAPRDEWWTPRPIEPPVQPPELDQPATPHVAVPSVGRTRDQQPQQDPRPGNMTAQTPASQPGRSWLAALRPWRIPITLAFAVFGFFNPIGAVLTGLAIYLFWFHRPS